MNVSAKNVCFRVPSGATYCGNAQQFENIKDNLFMVIDVDADTWEMIDLVMLFNLRWDVRNPGQVGGENGVQLKIYLSKDLYNEFTASGGLPADLEAFAALPDDHVLKSTVNWYATEVTEEVELPDHLKDAGSLRSGFTTKWQDEFR